MTERKPMTKRMVIMLICVGLLLAALVGFNQFRSYMFAKFMAGNAAPPATVSAVVAGYQSWQPQLAAVGSLRAVRGVDVTTEVAGLVREVAFSSGQEAKAGQVLVRLNADSDVALLQSLQAAAELAQTVYTRDKAALRQSVMYPGERKSVWDLIQALRRSEPQSRNRMMPDLWATRQAEIVREIGMER